MRRDPDEQREIDDFIASVPDEFRDAAALDGDEVSEPSGLRMRILWGAFFAVGAALVFGAVFLFGGLSLVTTLIGVFWIALVAFAVGFLLPGRILDWRSWRFPI